VAERRPAWEPAPEPAGCTKRDRSLACYRTAPGIEALPVHPDSWLIVSFRRHSRKYQAIDVRCLERGAPVRAVAPGVVDYVGTYMVRLRHETDAGTRRSVYTHVDIASEMVKGARVETGDLVGGCDVKGVKPHRRRLFPKGVLHFEWQQRRGRRGWRRIDPLAGRRPALPVS